MNTPMNLQISTCKEKNSREMKAVSYGCGFFSIDILILFEQFSVNGVILI